LSVADSNYEIIEIIIR